MGQFDDIFGVKTPDYSGVAVSGEYDDIFGIKPQRTLKTNLQDVAATAAKGITGLSDAAIGLTNIPTMGQAGRSAQLVGLNEVYDDPMQAEQALQEHQQNIAAGKRNEFLDASPYSAPQQFAQKQVTDADGVLGKLGAAVRNPSTIATAVGESVPSMLAGGMIGRGLALGTKVAPVVGGAIGEGLIGAGASAEQIRKESPTGTLTPQQTAMAVGSGVGTGIFGYVGGKVANKLGFDDADTLIANGFQRVAKKSAAGGAEVAEKGFAQNAAEVAGRIVGGGISEGAFEELPQSIQETMWQNAATGKPLTEGMDEAAVMGFLSGVAMGGPVNALPRHNAQVVTDTLQADPSAGGQATSPTQDPSLAQEAPVDPMQQDIERAFSGPISKAAEMLPRTTPGVMGKVMEPSIAPLPEDNLAGEWNAQEQQALGVNQKRNALGSTPVQRAGLMGKATAAGDIDPNGIDRVLNEASLDRNFMGRVTPESSLLAQGESTPLQQRAEREAEYRDVFTGPTLLSDAAEQRLALLERQMSDGEVGQRFQRDDTFTADGQAVPGEWDGVKSTNPEWIKSGLLKEAGKAGVRKVIDKMRAGDPLTNRQAAIWSEIKKVADKEYENDPATVAAKTAEKIQQEHGIELQPAQNIPVGNLQEGDKVVIEGKNGIPDVVTHKGMDRDGKAILQDGVTVHADPWDMVPAMGVKQNEDKWVNPGRVVAGEVKQQGLIKQADREVASGQDGIGNRAREVARGDRFDQNGLPERAGGVQDAAGPTPGEKQSSRGVERANSAGKEAAGRTNIDNRAERVDGVEYKLAQGGLVGGEVQGGVREERDAAQEIPGRSGKFNDERSNSSGAVGEAIIGDPSPVSTSIAPMVGKNAQPGKEIKKARVDVQGEVVATDSMLRQPGESTREFIKRRKDGKEVSDVGADVSPKEYGPIRVGDRFERKDGTLWDVTLSAGGRVTVKQVGKPKTGDIPKSHIRRNYKRVDVNETGLNEPQADLSPTGETQTRTDSFTNRIANVADQQSNQGVIVDKTSDKTADKSAAKKSTTVKDSLTVQPQTSTQDESNGEEERKGRQRLLNETGAPENGASVSEDTENKPQTGLSSIGRESEQELSDTGNTAARTTPEWAENHAKEVGGKVVYHDNEVALIEGFSMTGKLVYSGVLKKRDSRTRVGISSYTGELFTAEQKQRLVDAEKNARKMDEQLHNAAPDGPFAGKGKFATSDNTPTWAAEFTDNLLKMLAVDARVYLTTMDDAKSATSFHGPFAAIRSASVTSDRTLAETRQLPNGDMYIVFRPTSGKTLLLETLAHEVGHIVEKTVWKEATDSERAAVLEDFRAWRDRKGIPAREWVNSMRALRSARNTTVPAGVGSDDMTPYWKSFSEYFADQVSRWAVSSDKPLSVVERFFKKIAVSLRKIYASLAGERFLPAASMRAYLDKRSVAFIPMREGVGTDIVAASKTEQAEAKREGAEFLKNRDGFTYSADDIPLELARQAHAGSSFSPGKRAVQEREGYARHMDAVINSLLKHANTKEKKDALKTWFNGYYRPKYVTMQKALLSANSRTMSSMITGPANFPVRSNQKKLDTANKRMTELLEWDKKAVGKMRNELVGSTAISSTDKDAKEKLEAKLEMLEKAQQVMRDANKIVRDKKLSDAEKIEQLVELGIPEKKAPELLQPDFAGRIGFASYALTNNKAEINRIKGRISEQEQRAVKAEEVGGSVETTFEGGRVEQNYEDGYLRIYHDEKTSPEVRAQLKANGFRWAPSEGAWRRKLNNSAKWKAEEITGVKLSKLQPSTSPGTNTPSDIRAEVSAKLGKFRTMQLMRRGVLNVVATQDEAKRIIGEAKAKLSAAWHGSPHDFEKFKMSAIGTGEGAQAYGHGLYFAGSKEVAEYYRNTLSDHFSVKMRIIQEAVAGTSSAISSRIVSNMLHGNIPVSAVKMTGYANRDYRQFVQEHESELVAAAEKAQNSKSPGSLYQVELAPQEDEYLLWDKPLSEQSEKVKSALILSDIRTKYDDETVDMFSDLIVGGKDALKEDWTGAEIYKDASRTNGGDQASAEYLHSLGIRGIKYLDGTSRSKGEGAFNYVIFDENDVEIQVKYSKDGSIQGFALDGKLHLVADGIQSGNAYQVFLHEITHATRLGLSSNENFQRLLDTIERHKGQDTALGKAIAAAEARIPADTKPEHRTEEILSYLIENDRTDVGVVRRFIAMVKRVLVNMGVSPDIFSKEDFKALAVNAAKWQSTMATGGNVMRSVGEMFKPVDPNSPALKRWQGNSQLTEPVFHGSPKEFWTFDKNRVGKNTTSPGAGLGFFFATNRAESQGYAGPSGNLRSFYVKAENPKYMNASDLPNFRGVDEAQAYAKRQQLAGYDSIVLEDEGHVIVFEPNQVKSEEINTGAFDAGNDDVRYSVAGNGMGITGNGSGPVWATPQDSKTDSFIYNAQDKLIDMKRIQDNIAKVLGPIQEQHDVRMAEELYHKRAAKRVEDVLVAEVNPLMKELGAIPSADLSEFEEYMHALHAPEANESLRQRNPNEQELKALKEAAKADRDNLQQSAIVRRFIDKERELAAAERDVEAGDADDSLIAVINDELESLRDEPIVGKYLKAREKHRKLRHAQPFSGDNTALSGMSNEAAEALLANMPAAKLRKYKVLAAKWRRFMDKTRDTLVKYELESQETVDSWAEAFENYVPLHREDMENGMGIGQGFSVKGSATRSRTGSNRKVVDIIAHIVAQRERAIVRGEKAAISRALYGLAAANPNPEVWTIETPPVVREFDPVTGLVVSRPDPMYKNKPNAVVHRFIDEKGNVEERSVLFNEQSERGMRLAQALKNLDAEQLGAILRTSAVLTRWFSAINTQYNLVFGPVNAIRDAGSAMLHLTDTALAGRQAQVAKRIATGIKPLFKAIWAEASGTPLDTDIAKAWHDLQIEGGTTGFRDMFENAEERAEELKRAMLSTTKSRIAAKLSWAKQQVSQYNDVMENCTRLAVYMEARDQGLSKAKSASLAKNITLNFNRKGKVASQAGAMYAFFNASMQGTDKMYRTMTGPAGKKIMAGGLLLGASQAVLLAAAGFGDDEPPEFIKERAIIIPVGGKRYVTIPMPLGFNIIPNVARVATEWMLSGGKDTGERVTGLIGSFAETFNPIGNAGFSVQTIAPTVIDPLVALSENKDWTGKPIAKQNFNTLKPAPGHERMKDTASAVGIGLSRLLNFLSGGTEYTPGSLSPTPDQIDYLIGQAFGGVGRESLKAAQVVGTMYTGEDLPVYKIPLVSRFYGDSADSSAASTEFYRNVKRMNVHAAEIEGLAENRGDIAGYMADHPEAKYVRRTEATYRRVQKLQKAKRTLLKNDAPRAKVEAVEKSISSLMAAYNMVVEER